LLRHLRQFTAIPGPLGDGELLDRFTAQRDDSAFEMLVRRHGPLVLSVAGRVLRNPHDAHDVFQATFLTLAQKAGSIQKQRSIASWLHGVAYRLALQVRTGCARRSAHERRAAVREWSDPLDEISVREAQAILDEELARLLDQYRAPLVLCYLEGKTRDEAAAELGWSLGTLKRRLEQGRDRLRTRLTRRGLALPGALLAGLWAEGIAPGPALLASTVRGASLLAAGERVTAGLFSAGVVALLKRTRRALWLARLKAAVLFLAAGCLVTGSTVLAWQALVGPRSHSERDVPPVVSRAKPPSAAEPARTDLHGDPLPPDARMRLGTVRFRPGETVGQIAFSPDGKLLVSVGQNLEANGNPNLICVWDRATGKRLRTFGSQSDQYLALVVSPDGKVVGTQTMPGTICLWDLATGRELREITKGGITFSTPMGPAQRTLGVGLVFSPDGKSLAARAQDKTICLWEVATGKAERQFAANPEDSGPLAFSPDGKILATGREKVIRLWDVATARELRQLTGHEGSAGGARFSEHGKTLVAFTTSTERPFFPNVCVWDVATGRLLPRVQPRNVGMVFTAAFSPDLKRGAVAGYPTMVFDLATGRELPLLRSVETNVFAIAFAPDGKTLATAGTGRAIWLWDAETGKRLTPQDGHTGIVASLALSPDGKTLASVASDVEVWLWDLGTGKPRARYRSPAAGFSAAAFAPDGRTLAVTANDAFVRILDVSTGKELRRLEGVPTQTAISFSPDGKLLAAVSRGDGLIRIWDLSTGKLFHQLKALPPPRGSQPWFICLGFSPDGKYLATGAFGDSACIWSMATGKLVRHLPGHDYWVSSLSFSPDGRILATTSFDCAIRLWEVASGKERRRIEGHAKRVQSVAFAPDGRHLASGSDDQTVRVWDIWTGKERACFRGHDGVVGPLVFSPDGTTLFSGGWDTTILAWHMTRLPTRARPRVVPLADRDLEARWADLAGADAARADQAIQDLSASGGQSLPYLRNHLQPASAPGAQRVERLIADLGSGRFTEREQAMQRLEQLGCLAEPALRQALAARPALEVRRRIEQLLDNLDRPITDAETLRALRAIEVLERMGSADARKILHRLADGAPAARTTQEGRAALRRLGKTSR
jgi:RNA polymerase sigma factor (sigma-70 family)